jgi:cytochrome c oxidase assembly factor CtaG
MVAWVIHVAILWAWHLPSLYQATLQDEFIHALQHVCFLFSALLFWWALIQGRTAALRYGVAVLYVFTSALQSGLLGALITFARTVWYPAYEQTAPAWGLTPLEDQQLGGLIMWVPACAMYIVAGLALFAGWMRTSEERAWVWDPTPSAARNPSI